MECDHHRFVGSVSIIDPALLEAKTPLAKSAFASLIDLVLYALSFVDDPITVSHLRIVSKLWKKACDIWINDWYMPYLHGKLTKKQVRGIEWRIEKDSVKKRFESICNTSLKTSPILHQPFMRFLATDFAKNREGYVFQKVLSSLKEEPQWRYQETQLSWLCETAKTYDCPDIMKILLRVGNTIRRLTGQRSADTNLYVDHSNFSFVMSLSEHARACVENGHCKTIEYLLQAKSSGTGQHIFDFPQTAALFQQAHTLFRYSSKKDPALKNGIQKCARVLAIRLLERVFKTEIKAVSYEQVLGKNASYLKDAWDFLYVNFPGTVTLSMEILTPAKKRKVAAQNN